MATFLVAIVWISIYSYVMVWMITVIGATFMIPDTVMGLTFIAAGVSVPDALSGIAVVKEGNIPCFFSIRLSVLLCIAIFISIVTKIESIYSHISYTRARKVIKVAISFVIS